MTLISGDLLLESVCEVCWCRDLLSGCNLGISLREPYRLMLKRMRAAVDLWPISGLVEREERGREREKQRESAGV